MVGRFSPLMRLAQRRQECEQKQRTRRADERQINEDFVAFIRIVRVHCTESKDIISTLSFFIISVFFDMRFHSLCQIFLVSLCFFLIIFK